MCMEIERLHLQEMHSTMLSSLTLSWWWQLKQRVHAGCPAYEGSSGALPLLQSVVCARLILACGWDDG